MLLQCIIVMQYIVYQYTILLYNDISIEYEHVDAKNASTTAPPTQSLLRQLCNPLVSHCNLSYAQ